MKHTKPIIFGVVGFVIFAILFFGAIGVAIYKFNSAGRIVKGASILIPYPAARIDGHFIRYSDFLGDFDAIQHFYNSQKDKAGMPAPDKETLKKQIIDHLIENYFLEKLAKEKNISISKEDIENEYKKVSEQNQGEENLKKMLKDYYNWTPQDFKRRVVYYSLLIDKLQEAYGDSQKLNEEIKNKKNEATIKKYID